MDDQVALLAEGVDRNTNGGTGDEWTAVALLAEGVDRNVPERHYRVENEASPSSRRAWIEITSDMAQGRRNGSPSSRRAWIEIFGRMSSSTKTTSPSSRRAWIESFRQRVDENYKEVALLAEGVDRNNSVLLSTVKNQSVALLAEGVDRNSFRLIQLATLYRSPSSRRAWIEIDC